MSSHLTERDQLRSDLAKATDTYLAAGGHCCAGRFASLPLMPGIPGLPF